VFRFLLATGSAFAASTAAAQPAIDSAMRRLQPIIGTWEVDDTYRSTRGAVIRETGLRTCAYVLENRYVECITRGRNPAGREREYRWMLNYNMETRRYDLIGIFSNYTGKVIQTFRIDSTGTVWNLRAASSADDGIEQWHWAQLVFESPDRAVYTSYRNLETSSPTDWTVATRETWIRRP
jgi:hypothetical protein